MDWITKLERKLKWHGIPNLTMYMVGCFVVGYVIQMFSPEAMMMMGLNVAAILHGQIWRLVTWVLFPPSSSNVLFFIIMIFFFYYPLGTTLERSWGTFRYTLYIFGGMLATIIGAFLLYFVTGLYANTLFTTYYICLSIFLAIALTYPDQQVLLWFVIPIRMKWMAIVYGVIIVYECISYIRVGAWYYIVPILCSLINFLLFYFTGKDLNRFNPKEIRRRQAFQKAMRPESRVKSGAGGESARITRHKCAICGRTEKDDPNLEFRFCSKCKGNYEYCQDHLFTHKHVQ